MQLTFFFLGTTHGQHGASGVLAVSPAEELGPSQGRGTVSVPWRVDMSAQRLLTLRPETVTHQPAGQSSESGALAHWLGMNWIQFRTPQICWLIEIDLFPLQRRNWNTDTCQDLPGTCRRWPSLPRAVKNSRDQILWCTCMLGRLGTMECKYCLPGDNKKG